MLASCWGVSRIALIVCWQTFLQTRMMELALESTTRMDPSNIPTNTTSSCCSWANLAHVMPPASVPLRMVGNPSSS